MTLGDRLRQLRLERGLKQSEVALACGLTAPRMSDLERDRHFPLLAHLVTLAHVYGLTVQGLLAGVDGMGGPAGPRSRPLGLQELLGNPHPDLPTPSSDWVALLARIEHGGQRPRSPDDYLALFLHLRRVLGG